MPAQRAPARPAALETHLGFWMRMVSNQVSGTFRTSVEALGATVSEWVALRFLFDAPDATHGELVAALGMTKGAASKVARSLEDKGWMRRVPSAADARTESLRLTAAGRALVPKLAAAADSNEEHFFGHLAPAQRAALREVLEAIARRHGLDAAPVE